MAKPTNQLLIMAKNNLLFKKKYQAFFAKFLDVNYTALIGKIAERTPVDYGVLREGWAQNSTINIVDGKAHFVIYNPADYAAHVEYGHIQKPGMKLKMKFERGKWRFAEFLGYTIPYGIGEPEIKSDQQPDEDGCITIVTKKRKIPGVFMMRDSVDEMMKELPNRYAMALKAFEARNKWQAPN